MPSIAMIFNGVHFEQAVADKALAYAKQSSAEVVAIFLKSASDKKSADYNFPNDLDATAEVTTNADAEQDDAKIIESNMRLLEHEARTKQVTLKSQILEDPSTEQLNTALKGCTLVFAKGHEDKDADTPAGVDLKALLDGIDVPIELVR